MEIVGLNVKIKAIDFIQYICEYLSSNLFHFSPPQSPWGQNEGVTLN